MLMKQVLLFLSLVFFGAAASAQRQFNLAMVLTSPNNQTTVNVGEPFNLSIIVFNYDTTVFQASDTVEYYMLMSGDTTVFAPDNVNHLDYTNHQLNPMQHFDISRTMMCSESMAGMSVDICVYIKPKNGADPMVDTDYNDNKQCVTINVNPTNLGLPENSATTANVFPNPATTHFYPGIEHPVITDLNGAVTKADLNADGSIDCSNWANGVYLVSGEGMKQPVRMNVIH